MEKHFVLGVEKAEKQKAYYNNVAVKRITNTASKPFL